MGKSRLALEVAAAEAWSFTHGVAFVPLAPLSSAEYLASTLAQAVGVALSSLADPREQLIHVLREREILIILDNFEHLREGTALLSELLARAPGVQFVATSRERLDVEGEWIFELHGLRYPEAESPEGDIEGYSAVQLFLHSARRALSTFTMAKADGPAIARICRTVGGMPLAIELAAAWVRVISCAEISVELEQGLGFLSTSRHDVAERHRGLRAVFDNSWQLLTTDEQHAFRSLSVFPGGFEREAAAQIAGVTLPLLSALVDKTLVRWDHARRYDMHELIGEYAREKLRQSGDENAVRARHTGYVLQLAERAEPELHGPQQRSWLDRLDAERNSLRAALDWTLTSDDGRELEIGLRIVSALAGFWWMRGLREGRDWLARLLQHPKATEHTLARAKALALAGDLAIEQEGDHGSARLMYEESLSISRESEDRQGVAASLLGLGEVARAGDDVTGARALYEQSLTIWQELDEKWGIAWALHCLGDLAFGQGDLELARSLYDECLVIRREIGDKSGVAWLFNIMGEVARYEGLYERARALYKESLRLHREVANKGGVTASISNMGYVAMSQGDHQLAKTLFEESLSQNLGNKGLNALCLIGLAGVAQQAERAARLLGAAEPFRDRSSSLADRADHDRIVASVRAQLDETTFAVAWEVGRSMTLNQAIALALQEERPKESG
jgi:predicted ATPase